MLPVLSLQSEQYSATGNLAAEGFRKLLGTPGLDLLQTVVREATQNCCDAAKFGKGPEIHFRLRRLTSYQAATLRHQVFHQLPKSGGSGIPLRSFLEQDGPWVLEICDFGTIGLAGPTRADRVPSDNDATDFIDFLRNVGSRRDTEQGGGTYGYGKTALYLSSRCSTILVDTQTQFQRKDVRRLLGCHLGSAHELQRADGSADRFTGRHWWGVVPEGDVIADPALDEDAVGLADAVGFLPRSTERRGTSIMIVDPIFLGDSGEPPEVLMGMIAETLLWNFWPRMMEDSDPKKRIKVYLELDGQHFPLPAPEQFPPLDNFAAAMREIRNSAASIEEVRSQRPKKLLGRMSIRKGMRSERVRLVPKEYSIIPETSSHIAVMRPVELVVRYFEDQPLPDQRVEWAGVFISDADKQIEEAFAAAEPPAHDDWQPSMLAPGDHRTFVNVALRKIKDAAREVAAPSAAEHDTGDGGPSLAKVSGQFGRFLDSANGEGAGPRKPSAGKKPTKKQNRISAPSFLRLEEVDGVKVAVFETSVHHDGKDPNLSALAKPYLVVDGGAAPDGTWATKAPSVLSWCTPNGTIMGDSSGVLLQGYSGDLEIRVAIPDDFAVTLKASLEQSGGTSE